LPRCANSGFSLLIKLRRRSSGAAILEARQAAITASAIREEVLNRNTPLFRIPAIRTQPLPGHIHFPVHGICALAGHDH
jgi:hypothetical protein